MSKFIDYLSYTIIALVILGYLSEKFFPIEGLEIFYERGYYLAIFYIMLRIYKNFVLKRKDTI